MEAGIGVLGAFVKAGLAASNSDVRRQVASGGVKVNDATVADERAQLTTADLTGGVIKLSLGKKKHVLIRPV